MNFINGACAVGNLRQIPQVLQGNICHTLGCIRRFWDFGAGHNHGCIVWGITTTTDQPQHSCSRTFDLRECKTFDDDDDDDDDDDVQVSESNQKVPLKPQFH